MTKCNCGSYAINPGMHGRDMDSDLEMCDVCYWRSRATPWRSIAEAPKDGTPVLTYRGAGLLSVAAYYPYEEADWCCTDGIHLLNVTHFMPLPAPPTN